MQIYLQYKSYSTVTKTGDSTPYRSHGYVLLRFRGNVVMKMGTQQQHNNQDRRNMDVDDWRVGKTMSERYLYMFENHVGCDVTFSLGENFQVEAHKFILISKSAVFEAMFCGSMSENTSSRNIKIPDVEPDIFMAFLRFLYISEISLTDAITLPVLYAARKYCVEDLVKICADSLRAKMTPETVCDILEQAHVYDIEDLRKMCLQFIFENGNSVLKSSGFSELCSVCVRQIVESNELFVDESDVYLALITWAEQECCRKNLEKDGANKRASLNDLFYNIRFPVMDKVFFTDVVSADTVLTETEKVSLFQHLFGSSPKKSLPFAETKREARMIKCFRFPKNEEGEIKCEPGFRNSNFSIDVRSSEDVKLQGLILFGACSTSLTSMIDSSTQSQTSIADQHLKITVSALPHQAEEVFTTELDSVEIPQQKTYSIFLKTPVMLKKGRVYALQVKLDLYLPYQTYSGMEGLKSVCSGSVKFEFMTHQSLIATTVEKGQIAGLLFSKA